MDIIVIINKSVLQGWGQRPSDPEEDNAKTKGIFLVECRHHTRKNEGLNKDTGPKARGEHAGHHLRHKKLKCNDRINGKSF